MFNLSIKKNVRMIFFIAITVFFALCIVVYPSFERKITSNPPSSFDNEVETNFAFIDSRFLESLHDFLISRSGDDIGEQYYQECLTFSQLDNNGSYRINLNKLSAATFVELEAFFKAVVLGKIHLNKNTNYDDKLVSLNVTYKDKKLIQEIDADMPKDFFEAIRVISIDCRNKKYKTSDFIYYDKEYNPINKVNFDKYSPFYDIDGSKEISVKLYKNSCK